MIALIDADILVYRIGFGCNTAPVGVALSEMDNKILDICEELQTEEYACYLSPTGKQSFRFRIYPEYKANRKNSPKPVHYEALRDHLLSKHHAEIPNDLEADDALGEAMQNFEYDPILVSTDKDLNMIPGWHYNFVNQIKYYMAPEDAMKCFYIQLLMGDVSDNIPGIYGVGIVKATRAIDPCKSEDECRKVVWKHYRDEFGARAHEILNRNQQLLKIRGARW